MSPVVARTLAEAHTYLSLVAAAEDGPGEQTAAATATVEGEQSWTLTYRDRVEVEVSYESEQAARNVGSRFGLGVSLLVDAGQWVLVANTYAERAVAAITGPDLQRNEPEEPTKIELDWEFATDALDEALKFFDTGESELSAGALWSDEGRRLAAEQPERLTREKLLDDLEYFRGALADFRSLHGN